MKKGFEEIASRTRTIRWKATTDETAKVLAIKLDVSVSRLLEVLVLEEAQSEDTRHRISKPKHQHARPWQPSVGFFINEDCALVTE